MLNIDFIDVIVPENNIIGDKFDIDLMYLLNFLCVIIVLLITVMYFNTY